MAKDDLDAAETALTSAETYTKHHPEFNTLRDALNGKIEQKNLIARQSAMHRASMQRHLKSARQHLNNNNPEAALAELTAAQSYGINIPDYDELNSAIQKKIAFQLNQLQDKDIEFAEQQFWKLKRAVELKNLGAITQLTTNNQQMEALFEELFDRYVQIDVQLTDITTEDQNVYATLELQRMRLPDGNVNLPSSQYGSIPLSLNRTEKSWSKIRW